MREEESLGVVVIAFEEVGVREAMRRERKEMVLREASRPEGVDMTLVEMGLAGLVVVERGGVGLPLELGDVFGGAGEDVR